MSNIHIINVNVPASELMNGGATEYPVNENSFQFDIIEAVRGSHFELERKEFTQVPNLLKRRLKARLKASVDEKTNKHTSCNMSISPNKVNLRDMKIDHLDGERCFPVSLSKHGTIIVRTDDTLPAINKDDIPCMTVNLKKANDAFSTNDLFELNS